MDENDSWTPPPGEPLRVAWMTSLRELAAEGVGRPGRDPATGLGRGGIRRGSVEDFLDWTATPVAGGRARTPGVRCAGVIVDDDDTRLLEGRPGLWALGRAVPGGENGETLGDLVACFPSSDWARGRASWGGAEDWRARKAEAKARYEDRIREFLERRRIDLVIVDSYLRVIGPTLLGAFRPDPKSTRSLILNLHPGITAPDDPHRLPGRTPARDAHTRSRFGYVIVDDKRPSLWPAGRDIRVDFENRRRRAREVGRWHETGATLHFVDEELDHGEVIAEARAPLPGDGSLSRDWIREIHYGLKRTVLGRGLEKLLADSDFLRLVAERRGAGMRAPDRTGVPDR